MNNSKPKSKGLNCKMKLEFQKKVEQTLANQNDSSGEIQEKME